MAGRFSVTALVMVSALMSGCGLFSDADEKFYFGGERQPDELEYEYRALANELRSIKPCYLIHPHSLRRGSFSSVGSQVSLLRSQCFAVVGENSGDERICDKVRSASTLFLSGAQMNAESCRRMARVNQGRRIKSSTVLSLDVPEIVTLAGYEADEIDAYLVSEGRFSSVEVAMRYRRDRPDAYWGEVRRNLLHSAEFFERITDLPGFGTAEDRERMKALTWAPRQQRQWVPREQRTREVPKTSVSAESEQ